ncbi:4-hydroxybenzoate transporter PcaK [Oligella ureolytica]|uniref:4-hydroxybenzoate transporter PcaK n=1 Tax=Oligella ureolytica TaxID=90244 RepID=A0A378XJM9_9BURK|nr:MFS transporter [Oligella ureolytica]QPT39826.1 MFS transporter [Oligella ureolytica]SUA57681.1 4-hydroxybenzoate transporter PcaK [Oligella ureolytica]
MKSKAELTVKKLHQIIDEEVLSSYQWQIVLVCFLLVLLDGLDIAIVAYIAPILKNELSLTTHDLPYLFVSGVLGLMIGSMLFGPLADRSGRKKALIISTVLYASFTIMCGFAHNFSLLVIFRFLTGVGLGGAMPISLSLCTEYMPRRHQMILSTLAWCGFTLGIAMGGVVASFLLPLLNWQWLFYLAGIVPLLTLPLIIKILPESFEYLIRSEQQKALTKVQTIVNRLFTQKYFLKPATTDEEAIPKQPIFSLLSKSYRNLTLALWVAFFGSLLLFYLLTYWTPILLNNSYSFKQINLITMMLPIGGTVGAFILARWIDTRGKPFLRLALSYFLASCLLLSFPSATTWYFTLIIIVFCIGFTIAGAQNCLNLVAATVYENKMRTTGVSWAMAMGRLGSVVGSYLGIYLVGESESMTLFSYLSMIAMLCAAALFGVHRSILKP